MIWKVNFVQNVEEIKFQLLQHNHIRGFEIPSGTLRERDIRRFTLFMIPTQNLEAYGDYRKTRTYHQD